MLDPDLQALHLGRHQHLLLLGQHVLQDALVDRLLHDLEHRVLEHRARSDRARARAHQLADERVRAKRTCHAVSGTVDQRAADKCKRCEEHGVAVAHVGERDGVVVAPGAEGERHFGKRRRG